MTTAPRTRETLPLESESTCQYPAESSFRSWRIWWEIPRTPPSYRSSLTPTSSFFSVFFFCSSLVFFSAQSSHATHTQAQAHERMQTQNARSHLSLPFFCGEQESVVWFTYARGYGVSSCLRRPRQRSQGIRPRFIHARFHARVQAPQHCCRAASGQRRREVSEEETEGRKLPPRKLANTPSMATVSTSWLRA